MFGRRMILTLLLGSALVAGCTSAPTTPTQSPSPSGSPSTASPSASSPSGTAPSQLPTSGPVAADPRLDKYYSQHLTWVGCGGGFQCSTLTVPLDYADPLGATIGIKVVRLPKSGSGARLGSLILNPGGPGGSGIDYARAATQVTTAALRQYYDIVGFDPRGVGTSDPIHCLTGPETDKLLAVSGDPTTPTQVAQVAAQSAFVGHSCEEHSPELIKFVGTRFVARDLDILRAALGDSKLSYLGKSYGTFIGATYAEEFPGKVGRMVLDGAVDPSLTAEQLAYGQALGFELALHRFIADCLKHSDCPLTGDAASGLAEIQRFIAGLATNPLPGDATRQLGQSLGVTGIVSSLYDPQYGWPALRAGLTAAFNGDGSILLQIVDFYTQRNPNGTYADNGNDALYAVDCIDRSDSAGPAATEALAKKWEVAAPTFGTYLAWGNLPCYDWPVAPTDGPHRITAPGTPTILVVGTTHDPATPYPWAVSLASQLSKGVLLTYTGDGHTAYKQGSTCIDTRVDAFLISGTPPAKGTICN